MSGRQEAMVAYFISITQCQRDYAIEFLEKHQWKLDRSLNLFFEQDSPRNGSSIPSTRIDAPVSPDYENDANRRTVALLRLPPRSSSKTIVIPAMIEFQRFIESFNLSTMIHLLENSTKMMNLAIQYARHQPPAAMSREDMEDWRIHVKVDYTRLQTLLDHDMCAPLVWIEHLQHLLDGNRCQLFDCDYMFNVIEYDQHQQRAQ